MNRFPLVTLLATAALAAPAVAGASPIAHAAGSCGDVKTHNGGVAKAVYGNKVTCATARRVAKRAKGKRYHAYGFTCKPVAGLYSCYKPGTSKGIGFSYHRP
jgi:hypothetical protein